MTSSDNRFRGRAQPDTLLQKQLRAILALDEWPAYKPMVTKLALELGLDATDCAALLAYLVLRGEPKNIPASLPASAPELTMVRYRLEVGRKHQATEEDIRKLLIAESGVENRSIGRVDIHHEHTLIQLPDGMPGELYHHLKSVEFNRQPLRIKRLDGNHRSSVKPGRNPRRKRVAAQAHKNQTRQLRRGAAPQQTD